MMSITLYRGAQKLALYAHESMGGLASRNTEGRGF